MIENSNASKMPVEGEIIDIKKFTGVASISVVAINPNNETLRKWGWTIEEGAKEPEYVSSIVRDGKDIKNTRVRLLVQIHDLDTNPVIPLDFWCRPEFMSNREGSKFKIIDSYGRTAWGTKEEIKAGKIPQYSSGEANIGTPYKPCHPGQEELVTFLFKYLNVTPLNVFQNGKFVPAKNPGRVTIDKWDALCDGDMRELAAAIAQQPENRVKVVLGVRITDDNRTFQTFLNTGYIGNGVLPDRQTGEYLRARTLIDKYMENRDASSYSFSATPVKVWEATATDVTDNSDDMFSSSNTVVDDDLPEIDGLPF